MKISIGEILVLMGGMGIVIFLAFHPYTSAANVTVIGLVVAVHILFSISVSRLAARRYRSRLGWLVLSLIIDPLLTYAWILHLPVGRQFPSSHRKDRIVGAAQHLDPF